MTGANLLGANLEGADFTLNGKPAGDAGQQVTASAEQTVNNVLTSIFSAQDKAADGQAAPASEQEKHQAARRPVDEIPVIVIKEQAKETAPSPADAASAAGAGTAGN